MKCYTRNTSSAETDKQVQEGKPNIQFCFEIWLCRMIALKIFSTKYLIYMHRFRMTWEPLYHIERKWTRTLQTLCLLDIISRKRKPVQKLCPPFV